MIGPNTTIAEGVSIAQGCYLHDHRGDITIGKNTHFGPNAVVQGPVYIGEDCCIGPNVTITALGHEDHPAALFRARITVNKVIIERDVWIGANAVICPGVSVGQHSIVAAGAVVTHNVEQHSVVAGVPARVMRETRWPSRNQYLKSGGE